MERGGDQSRWGKIPTGQIVYLCKRVLDCQEKILQCGGRGFFVQKKTTQS